MQEYSNIPTSEIFRFVPLLRAGSPFATLLLWWASRRKQLQVSRA